MKDKLTMEIGRKIKGIFPVLILSLMLNTGITNGRSLSAGKKHSSSPKTLRSMARVYMAYGEYAKAQPLAEQALTLAKRNGASNSELSMCCLRLLNHLWLFCSLLVIHLRNLLWSTLAVGHF